LAKDVTVGRWHPIGKYLTEKEPHFKALNEIFLSGVYDGFSVADAAMRDDHKERLFCAPDELSMTNDQLNSILAVYVEKHKVHMDWPVSLYLLTALQEVFPCP
jgi:hypothetical protein